MLSKLMKYEFKATARMFLPIYAILTVLAIANRLTDSFARADELPGLRVPLIILLFIAFFTAVIASLVIVLNRFWNNLLGREGYLMHTLPVSPALHVTSKLIVSVIWFFATSVVSLIAMLILTSYSSVWGDIDFSFFSELFRALSENGITVQTILLIAELILISFVCAAYEILQLYFAMSVGQTANNHKVWASIGVFVGMNILLENVIFRLLIELFRKGMHRSLFDYISGLSTAGQLNAVNLTLLGVLVFYAALSALFFFLTQLMLKKKLNLK